MLYDSLNHLSKSETFKNAVLKGIAPDKGLFFPRQIIPLKQKILNELSKLHIHEIAFEAIQQFIGNCIPKRKLKNIIEETLCFDFPLVKLDKDIYSLELFHGPTLAFKDVGARFMARCVEYFNENENENITILVATSGDTGAAVADGFYNISGVNVVIFIQKIK